jgi:defect-in-organelle-trafficking protein DotB
MEAALTGHPVYTTLHSNGVAEVMRRLVTTFPSEERHGRTLDLIETIRLIIWQKLIPSIDGKRIALREYLVFDEEIRDRLAQEDPENVTALTRKLLKEKGQPIIVEAEKYYKQGLIAERDYKIIKAISLNADKDAGINTRR